MSISVFPVPAASSLYSRVAIITSSQTWTHPDSPSVSNPKPVKAIVIGGGGGGGSGMACGSNNESNRATGGGGGGSGCVALFDGYVTAGVSITIGSGGSGGAGVSSSTNNLTSGVSGTSGGNTSFGNVTALAGRYGAGPNNSSQLNHGLGGSGGSGGGMARQGSNGSAGGAFGWFGGEGRAHQPLLQGGQGWPPLLLQCLDRRRRQAGQGGHGHGQRGRGERGHQEGWRERQVADLHRFPGFEHHPP